MLKNKLKLIAILTIIILALTIPIVRAENETSAENAVQSTPNEIATENAVQNTPDEVVVENEDAHDHNNRDVSFDTTTDESFKQNDVYLTGDDVTIDYIIDGNLFVFANNVTINSQIGGDAFIFANTVTIGETGYIFSNLFTFSKNVTVNGLVYDLYAGSENTTINGYIYRDAHVGSNTVNIFGSIGRNAYIDCANLNFTHNNVGEDTEKTIQGMISGNLKYSANQEASIPEGSVTGETSFEQETSNNKNTIQNRIVSLATFIVTVVVIWLLCLWLAPKFLKNTTSLITTKKVLPVIGFGILAPIVGILLAILFLVLGITATLGMLLLVTLFVLVVISTSVFVIAINSIICNKLKIQKTISILGMLIVSSIVIWLVALIPYVGSIIGIIAVILGLGMVVSSLILKNKTENTKKTK